MMEIIGVTTSKDIQFVDMTGEVQRVLERADIEEGIVNVFTRHTTTAIAINENESRLLGDFEKILDKLVPRGAGYGHDAIDSNAHSHIRSILLGSSETIPVHEGRLQLGTWQKIFLAEFDGPRSRKVIVQVLKTQE
jgi:secondary thiamine-phosphate synthase enzyme